MDYFYSHFSIFFTCIILVALAQRKPNKDDGKIVGGRLASIREFPHQVSLQYKASSRHFCGGSLITTRHVLTASHCVEEVFFPTSIQVRAGTTKLSDSGGQTNNVKKITMHPQYNQRSFRNSLGDEIENLPQVTNNNARANTWNSYRPKMFDNDIAVIELEEPFRLNRNVRIVQLDRREFNSKANLTVSGWGVTEEGGTVSDHLQAVDMSGVNRQRCQSIFGRYNTISKNMICAGESKGGKDACQGDSGGPALSSETKKQVGVVSWGRGCARKRSPGVYTNVANYRDWLRNVTGERVL